jgi:hypothetical protein
MISGFSFKISLTMLRLMDYINKIEVCLFWPGYRRIQAINEVKLAYV